MKDAFITVNFTKKSRERIDTVNTILDEYRQQNFRLSLRQLYYQLVARDFIPNTQTSYDNLGSLVSKARQAGFVDWDMIEDRGRDTVIPGHWDNPGDIVRSAAQQFRIDKWADQPCHIEVMVEKDALSGVLEPVCRDLDIGITANKGYSSSSTMYEIGQRIHDKSREEYKDIVVIYFGDHDPSGIDMTRDIEIRLKMYSRIDEIIVRRLALNWDQVQLWQPPENPAKETDSRYIAYRQEFGDKCWELDAVEPATLADLVTDAVDDYRDFDLWDAACAREDAMRKELKEFADKYK